MQLDHWLWRQHLPPRENCPLTTRKHEHEHQFEHAPDPWHLRNAPVSDRTENVTLNRTWRREPLRCSKKNALHIESITADCHSPTRTPWPLLVGLLQLQKANSRAQSPASCSPFDRAWGALHPKCILDAHAAKKQSAGWHKISVSANNAFAARVCPTEEARRCLLYRLQAARDLHFSHLRAPRSQRVHCRRVKAVLLQQARAVE